MSQTSVSATMTPAVRGQAVDTSLKVDDSYVAEGNLTFGNLVQRGTDPDKQVQPVTDLSAIVADDNSIVATHLTTTAAEQTFYNSVFDGAIGAGRIIGAQLVTLTLNNHADWLASECRVNGQGPLGPVEEIFTIPAGGNVVLTGAKLFSRIHSIVLDAQADVNGTMLVGTNPASMMLSPVDFPGVVLFDSVIEPFSATAEIETKRSLNVRSFGRIKVQVEVAVEPGDDVFVRTTESGADLRGQFSGTAAAGFHQLAGSTFLTSAVLDGLATLDRGKV